jgi:protein-arginine deiminase
MLTQQRRPARKNRFTIFGASLRSTRPLGLHALGGPVVAMLVSLGGAWTAGGCSSDPHGSETTGGSATGGGALGGAVSGGASSTGGAPAGGAAGTSGSATGGSSTGGQQTVGGATAGGAPGAGAQAGAAGNSGGSNAGGAAGSGGSVASGAGAGGTGGGTRSPLSVLTDTNRDGQVDEKDTSGFVDWTWKGGGAFFIANVDDDDEKGETDVSDQIVNGVDDELDLARILIDVSADAALSATGISVLVTAGASQTRLFEKASSGWKPVAGALSLGQGRIELGIEAKQFADSSWDGLVSVKVELSGSAPASVASQEVKLRVAPWIMLPQSAKTELLYISSSTSGLRPDLDRVLESAGVPRAAASSPGRQDIWFQDTMEIGYTQLPGNEPMHVVMKAQRPNASDDVAATLLAPNIGLISIGAPRQPGDEEDHWMDWMGNLEVTHPVPGYPLGRIYYGKSDRTTFHPTIVEFLEAQQVQKPFEVYTNWLLIQHVDEVLNFLPDRDGKAKMIIVSPKAANAVLGSGYDAGNQQIQSYIDEEIARAKTELGLTDDDIIELPTFFEGGQTDYGPTWSNPVNSVLAGNTFMIGETNTPEAVKADVEQKLGAIGIQVAWVDDGEYHPGGGNVHCGTNTKKTPVCADFTACLP